MVCDTIAHRRALKPVGRHCLVALLVGSVISLAEKVRAADDTVTIVSWGGTTQDAERKSV
jgi:hypothetical protein